jgi:hypothetical protein
MGGFHFIFSLIISLFMYLIAVICSYQCHNALSYIDSIRRGVPTAALWETSEDRVEIIVKDRETSLLRAKRREYVRAALHVFIRHHKVGINPYTLIRQIFMCIALSLTTNSQ